MYVIQIVAFANGEPCSIAGQFVKSMDFDAFNGQGFLDATHDLKQAKKFETQIEAFQFYRTVSKRKPIRADGRPNRPMTASTVVIVNTEEFDHA